MPALLLLALVLLAVVAFAIAWFLRANPSTVARLLRPALVVLGGIGVGGLLIFGLRFVPQLLPELFGLAGVVIAALIARAVRRRPSGGFSSPGSAQRTEVHTAFLQAWIDHGTGDVGGTVLSGRFAGRTLDGLGDGDLLDRPLIQYAVEECLAAGIEEFIFVTGRNKSALEDHFDAAFELEAMLEQRGKVRELKQTQGATI